MVDSGLIRLICDCNRARVSTGDHNSAEETQVEMTFHASRHLAVYGTLAPGKSNYTVIRGIGGTWTSVEIEGDRFVIEAGLDEGYPAFCWMHHGKKIPAMLLSAEELPLHWDRLDRFEGPAYHRILIPIFRRDRFLTVANVYQARVTPSSRR